MSIGYGEENGGKVTLSGEPGFDALLMSRLDFEVRVLEIPPVPDREIEGLIRLRLRSVYPGNPNETSFDFRVARRGAVRRAVVFIARGKTVDAYREAAGRKPLVLPYLILLPRVPRRGQFRAWVCSGRWAEHLAWSDGVPISSTVRRLPRGKRFELSQEEARLPPESRMGRLTVVAPGPDIDAMERTEDVAFIPLENLAGPRRGIEGLFAARRRIPVPPPGARLAALGALVLLLGILTFYKYVAGVEAYDERLKTVAASLQAGNKQVLAMQEELDTLTATIARLDAEQPRDLFLLLTELSAVLGEDARIRGLAVHDESFQVDAAGTNPLKLMEGFKARTAFSGMKLAQVVPEAKTGRELFSFSGVFNGE